MDDSTRDRSLPNEILDQIFELVTEPLAALVVSAPAQAQAAQAAGATLRCCTLVSRRWHAIVARFLERNIQLPWTDSQLESYTSRARHPATTVRVLYAPRDDDRRWRLIKAFQSFTGVKRVLVTHAGAWVPVVLRCASVRSLTELHMTSGLTENWDDTTATPYEFHLEHLAVPCLEAMPVLLRKLLIPINNHSLKSLGLLNPFFKARRSFPETGLSHLRHLIATPNAEPGSLSLSPFESLEFLELECKLITHPVSWIFTSHILTLIATLPPCATLTRLSLPVGSTNNLQSISKHLDHPVLARLTQLRLPHLSRKVAEAREPGRAFLEVCEGRGIEVVLKDDLERRGLQS
ncbi:hypothetical protein RQP46_001516 [Phenoliferia psychrophenolica]